MSRDEFNEYRDLITQFFPPDFLIETYNRIFKELGEFHSRKINHDISTQPELNDTIIELSKTAVDKAYDEKIEPVRFDNLILLLIELLYIQKRMKEFKFELIRFQAYNSGNNFNNNSDAIRKLNYYVAEHIQ